MNGKKKQPQSEEVEFEEPDQLLDEQEPDADDDDQAADTVGIESLEEEVLRWKDLAQRTAAELDNFRKRAVKERENAVNYANRSLLEDLLPILDHFEMGMQAAAEEKDSMIYIGMDMVRQQLVNFLEAHGVTPIEAEGTAFDPQVHEALSQEPSATVPEGQIIRVQRRGYRLRDRLLRAASVIVSSGDTAAEE